MKKFLGVMVLGLWSLKYFVSLLKKETRVLKFWDFFEKSIFFGGEIINLCRLSSDELPECTSTTQPKKTFGEKRRGNGIDKHQT